MGIRVKWLHFYVHISFCLSVFSSCTVSHSSFRNTSARNFDSQPPSVIVCLCLFSVSPSVFVHLFIFQLSLLCVPFCHCQSLYISAVSSMCLLLSLSISLYFNCLFTVSPSVFVHLFIFQLSLSVSFFRFVYMSMLILNCIVLEYILLVVAFVHVLCLQNVFIVLHLLYSFHDFFSFLRLASSHWRRLVKVRAGSGHSDNYQYAVCTLHMYREPQNRFRGWFLR